MICGVAVFQVFPSYCQGRPTVVCPLLVTPARVTRCHFRALSFLMPLPLDDIHESADAFRKPSPAGRPALDSPPSPIFAAE